MISAVDLEMRLSNSSLNDQEGSSPLLQEVVPTDYESAIANDNTRFYIPSNSPSSVEITSSDMTPVAGTSVLNPSLYAQSQVQSFTGNDLANTSISAFLNSVTEMTDKSVFMNVATQLQESNIVENDVRSKRKVKKRTRRRKHSEKSISRTVKRGLKVCVASQTLSLDESSDLYAPDVTDAELVSQESTANETEQENVLTVQSYGHITPLEFEQLPTVGTTETSFDDLTSNTISVVPQLYFLLKVGTSDKDNLELQLQVPSNSGTLLSDLNISVNRIIDSGYLLEWLLLKSKILHIAVESLSSKLEIFTVNDIKAVKEHIKSKSSLPLPLITYKACKEARYYFMEAKNGAVSLERLLDIIRKNREHILNNCTDNEMVKDKANDEKLTGLSIKVVVGHSELQEWVESFKRYVLNSHLRWGFLQMWILCLRIKKYRHLSINEIAANLELRKASPYEMSVMGESLREDAYVVLLKQNLYYYLFFDIKRPSPDKRKIYITFAAKDLNFPTASPVVDYISTYLHRLTVADDENNTPNLKARTVEEINSLCINKESRIEKLCEGYTGNLLNSRYAPINVLEETIRIKESLQECFSNWKLDMAAVCTNPDCKMSIYTRDYKLSLLTITLFNKSIEKADKSKTFSEFLKKVYSELRKYYVPCLTKNIMTICIWDRLLNLSKEHPQVFVSLTPFNNSSQSGLLRKVLHINEKRRNSHFKLNRIDRSHNLKITKTISCTNEVNSALPQMPPLHPIPKLSDNNISNSLKEPIMEFPQIVKKEKVNFQTVSEGKLDIKEWRSQCSRILEAFEICSDGQICLKKTSSLNPAEIKVLLSTLENNLHPKIVELKHKKESYIIKNCNIKPCSVKLDRMEVKRYMDRANGRYNILKEVPQRNKVCCPQRKNSTFIQNISSISSSDENILSDDDESFEFKNEYRTEHVVSFEENSQLKNLETTQYILNENTVTPPETEKYKKIVQCFEFVDGVLRLKPGYIIKNGVITSISDLSPLVISSNNIMDCMPASLEDSNGTTADSTDVFIADNLGHNSNFINMENVIVQEPDDNFSDITSLGVITYSSNNFAETTEDKEDKISLMEVQDDQEPSIISNDVSASLVDLSDSTDNNELEENNAEMLHASNSMDLVSYSNNESNTFRAANAIYMDKGEELPLIKVHEQAEPHCTISSVTTLSPLAHQSTNTDGFEVKPPDLLVEFGKIDLVSYSQNDSKTVKTADGADTDLEIELIDVEHEEKTTKYDCVYKRCAQKFTTREDFLQHTKKHNDSSAVYLCPACDQGFKKKASFSQHWKLAHTRVKTFSCKICQKSFYKEQYLEAHKTKIHREDDDEVLVLGDR